MIRLSPAQIHSLQAAHVNACIGAKFAPGKPPAGTLAVLVRIGMMTPDKRLTDKGRAQLRKGIGLEKWVDDEGGEDR